MKKVILIIALLTISFVNAQDSTKVDNFQQTDKILSEVVKKAVIVAEKTGEFVIEQAPDLIRQFLLWHLTEAIFYVVLGIVIIIGGFNTYRIFTTNHEQNKQLNRWGEDIGSITYLKYKSKYVNPEYKSDIMLLDIVFSIIGAIVGVIVIVLHFVTIIYILVAPKIYLIEYFIK